MVVIFLLWTQGDDDKRPGAMAILVGSLKTVKSVERKSLRSEFGIGWFVPNRRGPTFEAERLTL